MRSLPISASASTSTKRPSSPGSVRVKTVLVTGGAGYVGSLLVPTLLDAGYVVTVYDICFFGAEHLPLDHPNLTLVEAKSTAGDGDDVACLPVIR